MMVGGGGGLGVGSTPQPNPQPKWRIFVISPNFNCNHIKILARPPGTSKNTPNLVDFDVRSILGVFGGVFSTCMKTQKLEQLSHFAGSSMADKTS